MKRKRTVTARLKLARGLGIAAVVISAGAAELPAPATQPIDFARDIFPIFERSCIQCHGEERPKARYRLTNREDALKGGDSGAAVLPGNSAQSPLVQYVAGIPEDMLMPPPGKAPPVTSVELSLIRAWIDQGAKWPPSQTNQQSLAFSVTPAARWIAVDGDEARFSEHTGLKEGFGGGIERFSLKETPRKGQTVTAEGRALFNPEDYQLKLRIEQEDLGFVQLQLEQWTKFSDPSGGYYPPFGPREFLNRGALEQVIGRSGIDLGLTLPNLPRIVLGYEHFYRDGMRATTHWGDVGTLAPYDFNNDPDPAANTDAKKIYPGVKGVDEEVHALKLDISHELAGLYIENNSRIEWADISTARQEALFYNLNTETLEKLIATQENHESISGMNALRLEKQLNDWLFLSGGYLYSKSDAEAGFAQTTYAATIEANDLFWFGRQILLDSESHVFNVNSMLGPWDGFSITAGIQNEWNRQHGFGDYEFDEGIGNPFYTPQPALATSDVDRRTMQEHFGLRYTRIPRTTLFADAGFEQEEYGHNEQLVGVGGPTFYDFLRDTVADYRTEDYRAGFTVHPFTRTSFTAAYRNRKRNSEFVHNQDEAFGTSPSPGYSAWITGRDTHTDEIELRSSYRPANWLRLGFTYKLGNQNFYTETASYVDFFDPTIVYAPGGNTMAGEADTQSYNLNVTLTPWRRLHLNTTLSLQTSVTRTSTRDIPQVVPYEGETVAAVSSATFILSRRTDLLATHYYSRADYEQEQHPDRFPVGLVYNRHGATAGLRCRFSETMTGQLE
ncbi:MAG TPA: c-type cytochrome domain-containing protein, partial [Methylomirabilota bacterium]|nr:c-type cytochrome domain-containing protein [Methylomirabilota bacterium]